MKGIWVIGLLIIFSGAQAQRFPFEFWHEGRLVLEEGDTIRGNIKYDLQNDLLQLEKDGKLESLTARKVVFFEIFDKSIKKYRQFYSLPYNTSGQYRAPVFFELLAEGKMTLLSRESIEYRSSPSSFYYYGSTTRLVLVNKYFLLKDNGAIEAFTGNRNDLTYLMGNYGDTVEKYIKSNKLSIEKKYDFAQIVGYYNSLVK